MPTNRTRQSRVPKVWVPAKPSPEYLAELEFKDFMGELTPEEIEIAKKNGIYKWDEWVKKQKKEQ
jgi:hypothetical protein